MSLTKFAHVSLFVINLFVVIEFRCEKMRYEEVSLFSHIGPLFCASF